MAPPTLRKVRSSKKTGWSSSFVPVVLIACMCFYVGMLTGMHFNTCHSSDGTTSRGTMSSEQEIRTLKQQLQELQHSNTNKKKDSISFFGSQHNKGNLFPTTTQQIASGMVRMNRDEFASQFDTGVPLDQSEKTNSEVLLLYQNPRTLPEQYANVQSNEGNPIPLMDVPTSVQNCEYLNVILTNKDKKRNQCIAIMGQYESYHVQKFMRLEADPSYSNKPVNKEYPFRLVNRGAKDNGGSAIYPPKRSSTESYWKMLQTYMSSLDTVLADLKEVAQPIADNHKNTVIVMTVNHGQSELLMNFACAARYRNIDTSSVLVFATDLETKALAEGLGLATFYDKINFGNMPTTAARVYLDRTFGAMMMAKVFCVQMLTMSGYDVLFQDVDMVWFKDPLEYFHDETNPLYNFDIYFQDDGNHAVYYAPYSANTGFYYVRSNPRTEHFFNSFLLAGDMILESKSHQNALIALLNEHASVYGLKVKILSRETDEFPGGFHYHRRKPFMKQLIKGETNAYIFHMSWTKNKLNKMKYFQQLQEWYLEEQCIGSTVDKILPNGGDSSAGKNILVEPCCLAEPKFECHFRDKASKYPCKDSPPIDKGRASWWK